MDNEKITIEKVRVDLYLVDDHSGDPKIECDSLDDAIEYVKQIME